MSGLVLFGRHLGAVTLIVYAIGWGGLGIAFGRWSTERWPR